MTGIKEVKMESCHLSFKVACISICISCIYSCYVGSCVDAYHDTVNHTLFGLFSHSCYRPLPAELMKYAREDTHYLIYIYHCMKQELLARGNDQKNLLHSVLQRSTEICAKV